MPRRKVPSDVRICQCGDHAWTNLTRGFVTLVSPEDSYLLDMIWWAWTSRGIPTYAGRKDGNSAVLLHRLIRPDLKQIDHENTNGFDNRRKNLRECNHSQNQANARQKSNKTGYRGVYSVGKKWISRIIVDKKQIYLGIFETPKEASIAFNEAAVKHFGDFARIK